MNNAINFYNGYLTETETEMEDVSLAEYAYMSAMETEMNYEEEEVTE